MPSKKKALKCYIYTRVSTAMQVDGYSLDAQRNRLLREAEHRGMEVAREFSDAGISGKNTTDRPRFTEMIRLIENGNPDGVAYVLVFKLSRFGRNAADVLSNLQAMQDNDVNLICVEDGIDSASPAGKILFPVIAGVAELERENIQAQTKAGRQQKAREGGWNGGQAPLGYRIEKDGNGKNGHLVVDEEEAELVRLIFDKFAHTEMGYSGVAKWLNANGYRRNVRQNNGHSLFADYSVKNILDNPVYTGRVVYGRFGLEKIKGARNKFRSVKHDKYDIYEGKHEAIIPEELWLEVQAKRLATGGKPLGHYGPKHVHMLSGIVRCPVCGSPMYGKVIRKRKKDGSGYYPDIYYYSCKNRWVATGRSCTYTRSIREEALDEQVIRVAEMALKDMDFVDQVREIHGRADDTDKLAASLDKLVADRKKQEQKKSRLLDRIENLDAEDEQYDAMCADLEGVLRRINQAVSELDGQIEEAAIRLHNAREGAVSQEEMLRRVKEMVGHLGDWEDESRRETLHDLLDRVEILPKPAANGNLVRSVRFKIPVTIDGGKTYGFVIAADGEPPCDIGDDEAPPDDDPSGGGGTPRPKAPAPGGDPDPEDEPSGGDVSHSEDYLPNPNSLPELSVMRKVTPWMGSVVPSTYFWMVRVCLGAL